MRFRFLFSPTWLALTLAVAGFAAACYWMLAPWQFGRNRETQDAITAVQAAMHTPAVPLDQLLPGGRAPDVHTQYRQISLTGHYLPTGEALARLRTVQGEAAYEVLTPFLTSQGEAVLVDRGYVRPTQGTAPPDYAAAPAGDVTVTARVRMDEVDTSHRDAFFEGGHRQVYKVNSRAVGKADGIDLRPGYVELVADQPGGLGVLPWPTLDSGPYLSYALQWLAFGTMALLAWVYYVWRELHPEKYGEKVDVAAAVAMLDRNHTADTHTGE